MSNIERCTCKRTPPIQEWEGVGPHEMTCPARERWTDGQEIAALRQQLAGAVDLRNAADKFLVAWDRRDGSHFSMIEMAAKVSALRAAVRGQ